MPKSFYLHPWRTGPSNLGTNDHEESCVVTYLPIEDVCQFQLKVNLWTCAVSSGEEPPEENPINWVSLWCLHWGPVQPGLYSEDKIHSDINCGFDGAPTVRSDSLCYWLTRWQLSSLTFSPSDYMWMKTISIFSIIVLKIMNHEFFRQSSWRRWRRKLATPRHRWAIFLSS